MKFPILLLAILAILFCYSCKKEKSNTSPKIDRIELDSAAISPGGNINVQVYATDPDNDQLNYSYSVSGGVIVGSGSNIRIIAPLDHGVYNLNVLVSDGKGGEASGYEVFYVNSKPIITNITITPESVKIDSTATIKVYAIDPDGDELIYTYIPDGGAISGTGASVSWVAPDTAGAYSVSVTVSDGNGGTATSSGSLTVTEASGTPTITGTASFPAGVSGDLSNAKVSIYTSWDNWNYNIPIKFTTASGSGTSVTFSMTNVLPGNYYLDVWKDNDNNANWSSGDYVGWYGSGALGNPYLIEFEITQGQTLNLNVTMYIIAKGVISLPGQLPLPRIPSPNQKAGFLFCNSQSLRNVKSAM